jgi:hypothetical protein
MCPAAAAAVGRTCMTLMSVAMSRKYSAASAKSNSTATAMLFITASAVSPSLLRQPALGCRRGKEVVPAAVTAYSR